MYVLYVDIANSWNNGIYLFCSVKLLWLVIYIAFRIFVFVLNML